MERYKVCVYAICKNEAGFVDRWMDSMGEADAVVVTDTLSTDDTVERLRARGATVFIDEVKPWRFDVARNISLGHVPEDADICVCTDLDEYFNPGWRENLEKAWRAHDPATPGGIARLGKYLYNWSLKPDGSPDVQFYYDKAHSRHGFRWTCPVHEYVRYQGALPLVVVPVEGMVLNHAPDPLKSRGSYLPLLEMGVREAPGDERMRYYLGREYLYAGEWGKCVEALTAYLALPRATWREERCAAMRWIAKAFHGAGQAGQAYAWYYRAVAEAPGMRDPYVEFAKVCYARGDWPLAYFLTEEALKIGEKSQTYVNSGEAWDSTPDDICAIAAHHLRLHDAAARHARRALSLAPENDRLRNNLRLIEEARPGAP
jgi:tetratricopeptide (TPR) repeat protein